MTFRYDQIETVHLEITSRCNASCPMCGRNKLGGLDNESLPLSELTLDQIKTIFSENFVKQIKRLYMCGNFGDPIVANDTLEVFSWLREINPEIRLGLHTNGSARTTEWWKMLGSILNQKWDYVKFGLDGLEDTNHVYRRGTIWKKIMDNTSAFISAGGNAHWEFIVFRHNEHQIDDARRLAERMGFVQFRTKKTGRFFSNTRMEGKDRQEVMDRTGSIEYYLEPPTLVEYQNDGLAKEQSLIDQYGSMVDYLDRTNIKCKVLEDKSIYISAEGLAMPCCWTANQLYVWYMPHRKGQIWDLIDNDTKNVSALEHDLQSIVEGKYFSRISDSWSKPSVSDGKLKVCAKTCGIGFDPFSEQFKK